MAKFCSLLDIGVDERNYLSCFENIIDDIERYNCLRYKVGLKVGQCWVFHYHRHNLCATIMEGIMFKNFTVVYIYKITPVEIHKVIISILFITYV